MLKRSFERVVIAVSLVLAMVGTGAGIGHAGDKSTRHVISTKVQSDDYAADLFSRAKSAFERKDYALATYCCSQVLDSEPDESTEIKTLFLKGKSHRALGMYSKAIEDYTGIIRLTNSGINQTLAYSYRAEMFEKLGNTDQALLDRDRVAAAL